MHAKCGECLRHKDDSAQAGHDLDHRTARFCAPARGMIYPGTKFRIGELSLILF